MNKENTFIDLPHTVLSKITNYLHDNLDKIIFTLVCKKWYDLQEKIIILKIHKKCNVRDMKSSCDVGKNQSPMRNLIDKSTYSKSKIVYGINILHSVDISSNDPDLNSVVLEPYINSIFFGTETTSIRFINVNSFIDKHPNVKKLSVSYFNSNRVNPSLVSKQITHLNLFNINQFATFQDEEPFKIQEGIETVKIFDPDLRDREIRIGELPSTLKTLRVMGTSIQLHSLPPALKKLKMFENYNSKFTKSIAEATLCMTASETFPRTLRKVSIHSKWLSHVKDLPLLTHVTIEDENEFHLEKPTDFPESMTYLDFKHNEFELPFGIIPTTVRFLRLGNCRYDIYLTTDIVSDYDHNQKDLLFFTDEHHIEQLQLGCPKQKVITSDLLPKTLNYLNLTFNNPESEISVLSLPSGIEKLVMDSSRISNISNLQIPDTVTQLVLSVDCIDKLGHIPPSVKIITYTINVANNEICDFFNKIYPSTVESIGIDKHTDHIPPTFMSSSLKTLYFKNCEMRKLDSKHILLIEGTKVHIIDSQKKYNLFGHFNCKCKK